MDKGWEPEKLIAEIIDTKRFYTYKLVWVRVRKQWRLRIKAGCRIWRSWKEAYAHYQDRWTEKNDDLGSRPVSTVPLSLPPDRQRKEWRVFARGLLASLQRVYVEHKMKGL